MESFSIHIDVDIFVIKLKANFLNNSPNEGMFKTANISKALLNVGKDNSLRKVLLYCIMRPYT